MLEGQGEATGAHRSGWSPGRGFLGGLAQVRRLGDQYAIVTLALEGTYELLMAHP